MDRTEGQFPALGSAMGLLDLIVTEWDALLADFRRFYALDLHEACFGGPDRHGIGVRDLTALVRGLPAESALARSQGWHWTERDEMFADVRELVYQGAWASLAALGPAYMNTKAGKPPKLPDPLPVPRPRVPEMPRVPQHRTNRDVFAAFSAAAAPKRVRVVAAPSTPKPAKEVD